MASNNMALLWFVLLMLVMPISAFSSICIGLVLYPGNIFLYPLFLVTLFFSANGIYHVFLKKTGVKK